MALITSMSLVPLAGVLLIVAVLAMSAYGLKTHAIEVDLPPTGVLSADEPHDRPINRLSIDHSGVVTWNDIAVKEGELRALLLKTRETDPQPELHFIPAADAAYGEVAQLLNTAHQAGVIDACFIFSDIWRFRRYEQLAPDNGRKPPLDGACAPPFGY